MPGIQLPLTTSLSEFTSLRLGGPPRDLIEVCGEDEAIEAARQADRDGIPLLVLGGGSNVVISDDGFPGTVMRMRETGVEYSDSEADVVLTARSGEPWDDLVGKCAGVGLSGVECLSGIPGLVGAAPIQNIGAYGQDVSQSIVSVHVYDRVDALVRDLGPGECGFGYRDSGFKRSPGRFLILAVSLRLSRSWLSGPILYPQLAETLGLTIGESAPLEDVRSAVLALRGRKGLLTGPEGEAMASAGSFFTNPVLEADAAEKLRMKVRESLGDSAEPPLYPQADGTVKASAAWLIERAGFDRGFGDPDGIAISPLHTLVLTNRGRGSTRELLALAHEIADGVSNRFGVKLHPEPVLVGVEWEASG